MIDRDQLKAIAESSTADELAAALAEWAKDMAEAFPEFTEQQWLTKLQDRVAGR